MLAIKESDSAGKCTPNLLPCRISHSGPVNTEKRYWNPEAGKDNSQTSYFRGRKLRGKTLKIPEGYQGSVLDVTESVLLEHPSTSNVDEEEQEEGDEQEDEKPVDVKVAEEVSKFDEIVVWNHEFLPDMMEDPFAKGMQEWIGFAQAMHSYGSQDAGFKAGQAEQDSG
ncbi:hypothetical protein K402DRAFT_422334 [Aulographum hederae CBS 113979]|uniref:Uncharacterized protein n=1 Tax=Aulographum hederae CBS 113979 TaxID=1176131 RepID=A0A6G1GVQ5_9PEZI|nr:hypothetical protein K402DRAFT_422334 [Aulographum hederae CBS 113979]